MITKKLCAILLIFSMLLVRSNAHAECCVCDPCAYDGCGYDECRRACLNTSIAIGIIVFATMALILTSEGKSSHSH